MGEPTNNFSFTILIPSWNNLPYLKLCIQSIRKHSVGDHQIIVHVNEGIDGTLEWLTAEGIQHTHSEENIGICVAVNRAAQSAKHDHIMYMNDDMYALPKWDLHLWKEVQTIEDDRYMLSSTMIEPENTGNDAVIHANLGKDIRNFREHDLLTLSLRKEDWSGASWPPVLVSKKAWDTVGGFSEEYSPGFYSDPDLSMKLWQQGCRIFKGVGKSQVYHFQQKSTKKVQKNDGRRQFMKKWGVTASAFYLYYLQMGKPYTGPLAEPKTSLGLAFSKIKSHF